MKRKIKIETSNLFVILALLLLAFSLSILSIVKYTGNFLNISCVSIPVIKGNGEADISILCSKIIKGSGNVLIQNIPIKDEDFQASSIFSYIALCNFDYEYCKSHDFLIYFKNKGMAARGGSGGAGLFLLYLGAKKNCSVTGYILPSGLALPIKAIDKKYKISKELNYKCILAPNEYKDITVFNDIFDLYEIYFNKNLSFEFKVPKKYYDITKEAAMLVCDEIYENSSYYYQASKCFRRRVGESVSINKDELIKNITKLKEKIENIKCLTYSCEEIKYQVMKRLNSALENINNISYSYWRYITALGWSKYFDIKYNREKREDLTSLKYNILEYILKREERAKNYFEMKEKIARYELTIAINLEDKERILKKVWNLTEKYLGKYGFSISSYNYLQYSKDLYYIDKDIDSSLYYAFLALEYSIP